MTTFAVAYLLAWGGVALYVLRLAARQRRLEDQLDRLGRRGEQAGREAGTASRAA